ncbi:cation diffusion facilitator family transporter [Paracoccus sp. NBH48]|uniref:cation diffusion facilitator family transporter n=1 Tax=Paracoccus sp. NBH48 TaxID=2596918 RepID=UPI002107C800|nr:cation diffusion facilitator family transporter [Paracoccus sp. NBH48]
MAINASAGLLNAIWCSILIRQGRRLRSPALVADGKHLLTDVVSSGGVLLGVGLAGGDRLVDPGPGAGDAVGVNILWSGWKVMASSVSGLLDEAVPEKTLVTIRDIISDKASGALEAHDLRTRHAGAVTFIDFHLVVDGQTTVSDAHDICDRVEASLKAKLPDAQITIHVEPEHKAKHSGVLVI